MPAYAQPWQLAMANHLDNSILCPCQDVIIVQGSARAEVVEGVDLSLEAFTLNEVRRPYMSKDRLDEGAVLCDQEAIV